MQQQLKAKRSKEEKAEILRFLEGVPLFAGLDRGKLRSLVELSREVSFRAGETIVKEDDYGTDFFLILEGRVEVRKKGGRIVATFSRSQFFGEMALLEERPRSADVVAVENNTRCLAISFEAIHDYMHNNPFLAIELLRTVSRRLFETNKALSE